MKQLADIYSEWLFYLLLSFLFLIPFSIAACYICFTLIACALIFAYARQRILQKLPLFFYFFLAYAFFTLLSSACGIDRWTSFKDNKELFIFLLLPIYIIMINSQKRQRLSQFTVLAAAVISAMIGIFQALTKGFGLDHRIKGLTSHWMTFAGLLMLVLIFFAIDWMQRLGKKPDWVMLLITAFALLAISVALLLSQTRSAWIGASVGVFLFLVLFKPRWMLIAMPLAIALIAVSPAAVKHRVFSIVDLHNDTNRDRLHMLYTGWQITRHYPLTGVGPNNIPKLYAQYKHPQSDKINMHLHNNIMQIAAERGILALAAWLAAWITLICQLSARIRTATAESKRTAIASLCVIAGFLAAGFFEYNFGGSQMKFLLFYFVSLPFASAGGNSHDQQ